MPASGALLTSLDARRSGHDDFAEGLVSGPRHTVRGCLRV